MMDSESLNELMLIEAKLDGLLPRISKHKIEELQRQIAKHFVKRFAGKRKICKYGHLNKGFTPQQLKAFFDVADSPKMRLIFMLQSSVALRIGEAVRVNIRDINFETRELLVRTEKAQTLDTLLLPIPLFSEMADFIAKYKVEIEHADGYVFFADSRKTKRKGLFVSQDYVRNKFREYLTKAGLDSVYSASDESTDRTPRRLHLLTTHSLRHAAITNFYNQTKDLLLTAKMARHLEPQTTTNYVHLNTEQLYAELDKSTALSEAIALKGRMNK